jgi:hypothetical protein
MSEYNQTKKLRGSSIEKRVPRMMNRQAGGQKMGQKISGPYLHARVSAYPDQGEAAYGSGQNEFVAFNRTQLHLLEPKK